MIMRLRILFALVSAVSQYPVLGQGVFKNLDFESVRLPLNSKPGSDLSITDAFPGWSGFVGTNQEKWVYYDAVPGFLSGISLLDSHGLPPAPTQGAYYVSLFAGASLSESGYYAADVSISQSGVVPSWAKAVLFNARTGDPGRFAISLNGQAIPHVVLSSSTFEENSLFGADVSAFAGQTVELRLTAFSGYDSEQFTTLLLDDIRFAEQAVPELSSWAILLLGLVVLWWRGILPTKSRARLPQA